MVSGISSVHTLYIHCVPPHYIVSFMKTASCVSIHCCLVSKSCLTLCNSMDYSTGGSSVHEISQARIRSELPSPFQGIFLTRRLNPHLLHWQADSLPLSTREAHVSDWVSWLLSHVWLFATAWNVCSLPGSTVHGILQARILEWVAIPFPKGSSWPRDWTGSPASQADSLPWKPRGTPLCSSIKLRARLIILKISFSFVISAEDIINIRNRLANAFLPLNIVSILLGIYLLFLHSTFLFVPIHYLILISTL